MSRHIINALILTCLCAGGSGWLITQALSLSSAVIGGLITVASYYNAFVLGALLARKRD